MPNKTIKSKKIPGGWDEKRVRESLKIILPPLTEQHRIVGVLEVWDFVIELLERKIEVKKNIKKGLMRNLLTATVRLPGFSGDWVKNKFYDLLDYEQPNKYLVNSTNYISTPGIPVLTAGKTPLLGYTDEIDGIYEDLPVIIFDDFTTASKLIDFKFKVKSGAIKFLKNKKDSSIKFVYEAMSLIHIEIKEHKRRYLSEYQYFTINTPPLPEQQAIAEVLTAADEEIEGLAQKLVLYKQQKKYLLNTLITGEIRVPEFDGDEPDLTNHHNSVHNNLTTHLNTNGDGASPLL